MGAWRISEGLPLSLDKLVVAFCADYERRRSAVEKHSVDIRTEMEYKYLNHRIFEGAAEVVGPSYAELYIKEIGSGIGYAKSEHPASCEQSYKREKQKTKLNIAKKLHLA